MSVGIFRPTPSNGLAFRAFQRHRAAQARRIANSAATRQQQARAKQGVVADAFADGCETIRDVVERTGLPKRTVDRLWKQVREGLGWQAQ